MTRKLRRGKSKVYGRPTLVLQKARGKRGGRHDSFNTEAHADHHLPRILVYTGTSTISTSASCPIYPPRGGRIVSVHLNVNGTAPSGAALTCDVLLAGATIFASDLPSIAVGEMTSGTTGTGNLYDEPRHPGDNLAVFRAFDKLQVQCTAVSSAVGPLVVQLEIDWDD